MAMAESFCVSLLGKSVLSEVRKLREEDSRHRGQQVQRPRGKGVFGAIREQP